MARTRLSRPLLGVASAGLALTALAGCSVNGPLVVGEPRNPDATVGAPTEPGSPEPSPATAPGEPTRTQEPGMNGGVAPATEPEPTEPLPTDVPKPAPEPAPAPVTPPVPATPGAPAPAPAPAAGGTLAPDEPSVTGLVKQVAPTATSEVMVSQSHGETRVYVDVDKPEAVAPVAKAAVQQLKTTGDVSFSVSYRLPDSYSSDPAKGGRSVRLTTMGGVPAANRTELLRILDGLPATVTGYDLRADGKPIGTNYYNRTSVCVAQPTQTSALTSLLMPGGVAAPSFEHELCLGDGKGHAGVSLDLATGDYSSLFFRLPEGATQADTVAGIQMLRRTGLQTQQRIVVTDPTGIFLRFKGVPSKTAVDEVEPELDPSAAKQAKAKAFLALYAKTA